jgi:hypothetical protein
LKISCFPSGETASPVPKMKHPIPIIKSRFEDEDEEESTDSTLGSNESKDAGK